MNRLFEAVNNAFENNNDINKEYRYITNHGVGPGMCPDNTFIRSEDLDNNKTAIYLNRPLSDEELKKYDIKPEWIQEDETVDETKADREDLKNLYYMDRVLRCMNDENALSDGWLMNYVADGDSDYGINSIVDEYSWMSKKDIADAYEYYKKLVASTVKDGIISREFYRDRDGVKPNAGASRSEIAFVKKDFPDIKVITKSGESNKESNYQEEQANLNEQVLADGTENEIRTLIDDIKTLQSTIKHTIIDEMISINARIQSINENNELMIDEIEIEGAYANLSEVISDMEYELKNSEWSKEEQNESEELKRHDAKSKQIQESEDYSDLEDKIADEILEAMLRKGLDSHNFTTVTEFLEYFTSNEINNYMNRTGKELSWDISRDPQTVFKVNVWEL